MNLFQLYSKKRLLIYTVKISLALFSIIVSMDTMESFKVVIFPIIVFSCSLSKTRGWTQVRLIVWATWSNNREKLNLINIGVYTWSSTVAIWEFLKNHFEQHNAKVSWNSYLWGHSFKMPAVPRKGNTHT